MRGNGTNRLARENGVAKGKREGFSESAETRGFPNGLYIFGRSSVRKKKGGGRKLLRVDLKKAWGCARDSGEDVATVRINAEE